MFVVQSVVDSIIRPVLGRFIKGGEKNIQFEKGTGSMLHLKDLEFREDALNLLLARATPHLHVASATLGSVRVDMGWKGGSIEWNDIAMHLSSSATDSRGAESLDDDNPMGWSLRSYSSDDMTELESADELITSITDLRNRFSSPILSVQRKFDEISESLVHKFSNIVVDWDGLILTITSAEYSLRTGLKVQEALLRSAEEVVLTLRNLCVPGFSSEDLGKTRIGEVELVLMSLLQIVAKTTTTTSGNAERSDLSALAVEVESIRVTLPLDGAFIQLWQSNASAHPPACSVERGCVKNAGGVQEVSFEGLSVELSQTKAPVVTDDEAADCTQPLSGEIASSPFEDDKMFLFRSQRMPAAVMKDLEQYQQRQQQSALTSVVVRCRKLESVTAIDPSRWIELAEAVRNILPAVPPTNVGGVAVDLKITDSLELRLLEFPLLRVEKLSLFREAGEFWSASAKQINLGNNIARHIRVAGENMKRVSVDVAAVLLDSVDELVALALNLPPMDEEAPPMDIFIRAKHLKMNSNVYWCRDLRASNVELFTGHGGTTFTITASRVESKRTHRTTHHDLRATVVQIILGGLGRGVKVSLATLSGVASDEDIREVIASFAVKNEEECDNNKRASTTTETEEDEETTTQFSMSEQLLIRNYRGETSADKNNASPDERLLSWKLTVRQSRLKLWSASGGGDNGHMEVGFDMLKMRSYNNRTSTISVERVECLDRTAASVWNKAVIIRGLRLECNAEIGNYVVTLGTRTHSAGRFRKEDVTLTLDQCFIDYVASFISSLSQSQPSSSLDEEGGEGGDNVWLSSIRVEPFKARVDYKPSRDANHLTPHYLRYLPLRSAVIKVERFDAFDLASSVDLSMKFALHVFGGGHNLSRIIAGFKPIRTPANVFRNATELLLVPLNVPRDGMQQVIRQARQAATRTAISVLELGPALNIRPLDGGPASVHSNQPSGVKEGLTRAGTALKDSTTTVVAFVTGDLRNVDIFDLPIIMMRPFTAPLAEILNGVCNQLDRDRYARMKDKYR